MNGMMKAASIQALSNGKHTSHGAFMEEKNLWIIMLRFVEYFSHHFVVCLLLFT